MPIDYGNLVFSYKWHDVYNKLPFVWKCPFCKTINTLLDNTKNANIECTGLRCDGKLILV